MASTAGNQALGDTVERLGKFGDEHAHALGDNENSHGEREARLQDIDRPVGIARHRLYGIDAEGEQDRAEENGHHNGRGDDVVVKDVQPARQLKIFNALLLFTQIRSDLVSNP